MQMPLNQKTKALINSFALAELEPTLNQFKGSNDEKRTLIDLILSDRNQRRLHNRIIERCMVDHGYTRLRAIEELNSGNLDNWLGKLDWDELLPFLLKLLQLLILFL